MGPVNVENLATLVTLLAPARAHYRGDLGLILAGRRDIHEGLAAAIALLVQLLIDGESSSRGEKR
jgi:hypothetical protein